MTDYISREAALEAIKTAELGQEYDAVEVVPAADVVEVVRCRECKYLNEDLAIGEWDGSCRFWNTHSVTYSWFCANGERKDGADNE